MAVSVASRSGDLLGHGLTKSRILPLTTGLVKCDPRKHVSTGTLKGLLLEHSSSLDLCRDPQHRLWPEDHSLNPPTYEESQEDTPPDYTATDAPAIVNLAWFDLKEHLECYRKLWDSCSQGPAKEPTLAPDIDFSTPHNVRVRGKKKAKQAAARAQKDKWADDDDEEQKPADDGEQNGDNDGGDGAGAGGAGGGDGNGGDDGDDWDDGKKKKGKKDKKKNAFSWDEDDEDQKKEDEELKKKEEEDAALAASAATIGESAGGDANPDDEWGGFATAGKKKKGKKGKNVEPTPPPPPPAPAKTVQDTKFDDIDLDDKFAPKLDLDFGLGAGASENKSSGFGFGGGWGGGWGSGGNTTAKSTWNFSGAGDDLKTSDAFGLDSPKEPKTGGTWGFGRTNGNKKDDKKKATSGFEFDFDDLGEDGNGDVTNVDLDASATVGKLIDDDPWGSSATTTKKGKKGKKGTNAFDEVSASSEPMVVVVPEPVATVEDPYASWGPATKSKKKNKKGGEPELVPEIVDVPFAPPPPPPIVQAPVVVDPTVAEHGSWGGIPSATKKKGKKNNEEPEPAEPIVAVLPEPDSGAAADDVWGGFDTSAKDKKKAKKAGRPSKEQYLYEEPATFVVPESAYVDPAPTNDFGMWDTTTNNKDNKKKKAVSAWDEPEPGPVPGIGYVAPFENHNDVTKSGHAAGAFTEPSSDWLGGGWGDPSKKNKKGKKGAVVEETPAPPPPAPPAPPAVPDESAETNDNDYTFGWASTAKKDKKTKKGKNAEPEMPSPPTRPAQYAYDERIMMPESVDEPKADGDDEWNSGWGAGTKKKKKDSRKDAPVEVVNPSPDVTVMQPVSIQESRSAAEEDTSWGMWGAVGKKEKKKGKKDSLLDHAPPAAPTPPGHHLEDIIVDVPPPPPGLVDVASDPADGSWGFTTTTKKGKKSPLSQESSISKLSSVEESKNLKATSKNGKHLQTDIVKIVEEATAPAVLIVAEESPPKKEEPKPAKASGWGIFGSSKSKTSAKDKEKEKKEKEEKEKRENEERERREKEAAEEA
ncbi:hypothetical protein LTR66_004316, partial [Elasticomyces elasticus]